MLSLDIPSLLDLAYDFRDFLYDHLPQLTTPISSLILPTAYLHTLPPLIAVSLASHHLTTFLPLYVLLSPFTYPLSLYHTYYLTPTISLLRSLTAFLITTPTHLFTKTFSLLTRLCSLAVLSTELQILLLWTALIAAVIWKNAAGGASGWEQLVDHAHLTELLVVEGFWVTRWGMVRGQGEVLEGVCGKWVKWLGGEGEKDGWEGVRVG